MKKLWGVHEAKDLWRLENGGEFDAANLHPVVMYTPLREYTMGIPKDDEGEAVIVHSYSHLSQPGAARNFALMVWNEKEDWTKPDLDMKVISCVGAPQCEACMGEELPMLDVASRWRVNPFLGGTALTASRLLDPTDHGSDLTTSEHVFAELDGDPDDVSLQAELVRRCVALFGPAHDIYTGRIYPVYSRVCESNER